MWLFKSKEEKAAIKKVKVEKQFQEFVYQNKEYFNSYAFDGRDVVIFHEAKIIKGEVCLYVTTSKTKKGYMDAFPVWLFNLKYGNDFMKNHRNNFINIRLQLEQLGLKIEKNEIEKNEIEKNEIEK